LVSKFWGREKFLAPDGSRTTIARRPSRCVVKTPTVNTNNLLHKQIWSLLEVYIYADLCKAKPVVGGRAMGQAR